MLLRGRDVGRYELNEMTAALGIPLSVYGNQFSKKLGPEETLRQLTALLSSTTLSGLSPSRSATGLRRLVEKTVLLSQLVLVQQERIYIKVLEGWVVVVQWMQWIKAQ